MTPYTPSLAEIHNDIRVASEQHKQTYGEKNTELLTALQKSYSDTCAQTLSFLAHTSQLAPLLQPVYQLANTILQRNSWIGWELCDLGAVLDIAPLHTYSYAMVAYNALHFLDDGIDGHSRYTAIDTQSIYGYLLERGMSTQEAAAASGMLGMAISNEAIYALLRSGYSEEARILLRLATRVYTGMFAESLTKHPASLATYQHIVAYKSIAYQMFLDQVFLHDVQPFLRTQLLRINASIVRLGQIVDDLMDDADDKASGCMSILAIPTMERSTSIVIATKTLADIWADAQQLPSALCNAIATRIAEWVYLLQHEAKEGEKL